MIGISNSICLLLYYCFFLFSSIGYLIFFTRGYFFLKEIFAWHLSAQGVGGNKKLAKNQTEIEDKKNIMQYYYDCSDKLQYPYDESLIK